MNRYIYLILNLCLILLIPVEPGFTNPKEKLGFYSAHQVNEKYDVVVVGATPGGIMSAIAAARLDASVILFERTAHIGGLPANGLGATDIGTRAATGGLFLEFVERIKNYYISKYGAGSQQVNDCSDGYHFEPSVAEKILKVMIEEESGITLKTMHQFDADPSNVEMIGNKIVSINVVNRETGQKSRYRAGVFIDGTYEGDLSAAAGVPYFLGREGYNKYQEPYAGVVYKMWRGDMAEGSTQLGDNAIQAYNYRLCLTKDPDLLVPIEKPERYNRDEYVSMIDDVKTGRTIDITMLDITEDEILENERRISNGLPPFIPEMPRKPIGMQRVVNKVTLPNNKVDANNQHLAFISTDLPEENWPWPTSSWIWRDKYAERLKEYTLGLLWFAQNDPELPEWFKEKCKEWGLAKDEYTDNHNFPRQVYVREGRRMKGEHIFTAHDARPIKEGERPPVHATSITASHYAIDSHAVRKREKGRASLDGILSYSSRPYTVPFGVMIPEKVENLLMPVPVSASHLGYATLRMEPCWMALGQAAGIASVLALNSGDQVQNINIKQLQKNLLQAGAILMYFRNITPKDPQYPVLQYFALEGCYKAWEVDLNAKITPKEIEFIREITNQSLKFNSGNLPSRRAVFAQFADLEFID